MVSSNSQGNAISFTSSFVLEIYNPASTSYPTSADRIDWINVDPELTKLVISTAAPGGFDTLDVGTLEANPLAPDQIRRRPLLPRGIKLRNNAHIRLRAGRNIIFEGRLTRRQEPAIEVRAFTAKGYTFTATTDHIIYTSDGNSYTSGGCLRRAIAISAPFLKAASSTYYVDPSVPHAFTEFNQQNASQVIDRITKEGGLGNIAYDFFVWQDGIYQLIPRIVPAMADYVIPYDPETITWVEDVSNLYGTIQVAYTDVRTGLNSLLSIPANDGTFSDRNGISRDTLIKGGTMSAGSASAFAQTYLTAAKTPTYTVTVQRDNSQGLTMANGTEQPPWLVRSGQWVRVADQVPLPIVRTQYDASQGKLEIELGNPFYSLAQTLQNLRTIGVHVTNVTNVSTGAPA